MLKPLILAVLFAACATHEPPYVQVVAETPEVAELGIAAVGGWSALGFVSGLEDTGLPECDRTWYSDTFESDCQITLRVELVPGLSDDDVNGAEVLGMADQDRRIARVNARLTGDAQQHTMLHEVGHILLDSMHLDSYIKPTWGKDGVMRSSGSNDLEPTADDYAMACHTIGICVTAASE